jgi:hypothetical protein
MDGPPHIDPALPPGAGVLMVFRERGRVEAFPAAGRQTVGRTGL